MIFISSYIQKWGGRVERIPPDFRKDFLRPHLMPTLPTFLFCECLWCGLLTITTPGTFQILASRFRNLPPLPFIAWGSCACRRLASDVVSRVCLWTSKTCLCFLLSSSLQHATWLPAPLNTWPPKEKKRRRKKIHIRWYPGLLRAAGGGGEDGFG